MREVRVDCEGHWGVCVVSGIERFCCEFWASDGGLRERHNEMWVWVL